MNEFQILDTNGEPISMNILDHQACTVWGHQEPHEKAYVSPKPRSAFDEEGVKGDFEYMRQTNWFDAIGWAIATQGNYTTGWDNVKCKLMAIQIEGNVLKPIEDQIVSLVFANKYLAPYFELISIWQMAGFTPKQIKKDELR